MNFAATDITNDETGRLEAWIRNRFKVPGWASDMSKEASAVGTLPNSSFAWPEARLFPVHTKEDAWWSAVSLGRMRQDENAPPEVVEKIAHNLSKAVKFWGIGADDFTAIPQPVEKEAAKPFELILYVQGAPLDTIVCNTSEEFEKTAEWLTTEGRRNYPYETRRDAARVMLANECGRLPEKLRIELEKTACYGAVTRYSMIRMLDILSNGLDKLGYPEFDGVLDKTKLDCPDIMSGPELDKTAALIDGVHRALRVMNKAEGVNVAPFEETLDIQTPTLLEKAASTFVVLPDGRFIDDEEFEKHAGSMLAYVNDVLGQKATPETLRDVVEDLDDEKSAEFTEAMAALGI